MRKGEVYVAGEFNSGVGKQDQSYRTVTMSYGNHINDIRMIDLCMLHY